MQRLARDIAWTLAAASILYGSNFQAVADPRADADAAIARGDYATALRILRPLADDGVAGAQHRLCAFHFLGLGVPRDYKLAMSWCLKAAQQESPSSQHMLATMYEHGLGTAQNYASALAWYHRAADHGFAPAQYNLAVMYQQGEGVANNDVEASAWYRKAAEQGFPLAESNLGMMYQLGRGVPEDHAIAATWYRKAADQGYPFAENNLGMLYLDGDGVPQDYVQAYVWLKLAARASASLGGLRDSAVAAQKSAAAKMTQEQIAAADRRASAWRPVAAKAWSTMQLTSEPELQRPELGGVQAMPAQPHPGSADLPKRVTTTRITPSQNAAPPAPSLISPRPVTTTRIRPAPIPFDAPVVPEK